MKDYQQRVIDEKNTLETKTQALNNFILSAGFERLDQEDKNLLNDQFVCMTQYLEILEKRIARFQ